MKEELSQIIANEFTSSKKGRPIRVLASACPDSILSASILTKTFQRLDQKFSIKFLNKKSKEVLKEEFMSRESSIFFLLNIPSEFLENILPTPPISFFLSNKHDPELDSLKNFHQVNFTRDTFSLEEMNGSTLATYSFAVLISDKNKDLSSIAAISLTSEKHFSEIPKNCLPIIDQTKGLSLNKGSPIYPANRPLKRVLEYLTNPSIPGITGSSLQAKKFLESLNISPEKTLLELTSEEISLLNAAALKRRAPHSRDKLLFRNVCLLDRGEKQEDLREFLEIYEACSFIGASDSALMHCIGNKNSKSDALKIYTQYQQKIAEALGILQTQETLKGKSYELIDFKGLLSLNLLGKIQEILFSFPTYPSGTILIMLASQKEELRVSLSVVGKGERNLKSILRQVTEQISKEIVVSGSSTTASCTLPEKHKESLLKILKKSLELEVISI